MLTAEKSVNPTWHGKFAPYVRGSIQTMTGEYCTLVQSHEPLQYCKSRGGHHCPTHELTELARGKVLTQLSARALAPTAPSPSIQTALALPFPPKTTIDRPDRPNEWQDATLKLLLRRSTARFDRTVHFKALRPLVSQYMRSVVPRGLWQCDR